MKGMDYAREAIDERLQRASRLSASLSSATPRVPMAGAAIELRLRQASELSRACFELGKIGR